MLIPEIVLVSTVNKALNIVRNNYNDMVAAGHEERSLLYLLYNGIAWGNYNYYDNAKSLLITTPENPKHLEIRPSFDSNRAIAPSLYLSLASDIPNVNSLSIGEGDQEEVVFNNIPSEQDQYVKQYRRGFSTTYRLMIVTENRTEMSILYNMLRAILISCTNHLAIEGIDNLKIGGQDLVLNPMPPDKVFMRAITLEFHYEVVVPTIFIKDIFRTLRFIPSIDQSPTGHYSIDNGSDSI